MKRITFFSTSDLYYDQRMLRIVNVFLDEGYVITFYSRNKSGNPIHLHGLTHFPVSTIFKSSWLFYAEYNLRLLFNNFFKKSDLLYCVDADTLLVGTLLNMLFRNILIYDAHEFFEESPEIVNKNFIKKIWHDITMVGVRRSSICLTVGNALSKELQNKFGKKFYVIRNIPMARNQPISPFENRKKIIWYQGVLNTGRGLEQMIDAMQKLPDYELHLAGEGDLSATLRNKVENMNLHTRVKFLGKLSKDELNKNNQEAFVGINLLEGFSLNYYYSLANRTFDYLHAGLPAIHMNFPEYASILQTYEIGITIDQLEIETIINAIQKFKNQDFYSHVLQECQRAASHFHWDKEKIKLIDLITKIKLIE